jgi:hypothetical protein
MPNAEGLVLNAKSKMLNTEGLVLNAKCLVLYAFRVKH